MPIGIWRIKPINLSESLPRGSAVLFCPPDNNLFRRAKAVGILHEGRCKGSYTPLLKEVVGVPGDLIDYSGSLFVNGRAIPHSKVLAIGFSNFEPGERWSLVVPEGEVWLMGTSSFLSFDGRYFGLIDRDNILGIAHPIFFETFYSREL